MLWVKPKKKAYRVSQDEYFMQIAEKVSARGTCPRKKVGAILVRDGGSLATGYNGSVRKMAHCIDVGCMMHDGHCVRTIHAEVNAVLQAAKNVTNPVGATIYTTASPCWNCFKLIANAGIVRIVYRELYRDDRITDFAQLAGIRLLHLQKKGKRRE